MLQAMSSTLALLMALAPLTPAQTNGQARESVIRIVEQIKRADYEGDRVALKRLHGELKPLPDSRMLASRGLYWRGFAFWRRAINGFNESPFSPRPGGRLECCDCRFQRFPHPAFVESKIGIASCFGYLAYLSMKDSAPYAGYDPAFKFLSERRHGVRSR
jgi:hypothetical protein